VAVHVLGRQTRLVQRTRTRACTRTRSWRCSITGVMRSSEASVAQRIAGHGMLRHIAAVGLWAVVSGWLIQRCRVERPPPV
jgi:hypothetical protein